MNSIAIMARLGFEARLALRYLAGARGQGTFSLLTVLAILGNIIGVAALVVGQAIMSGIETHARETLIEQSPHLWLLPASEVMQASKEGQPELASCPDLGLSPEDMALLGLGCPVTASPLLPNLIPFGESLIQQLETVEGLRALRPILELDVFVNLNGIFSLTQLRGVSLAELQNTGAPLQVAPPPNAWGLIVPQEMIWRGQLEIGQILTLITTHLDPTPIGRLPLTQDFEVVAAYPGSIGDPLLTTLATTQFLLNTPGQAGALEVFVHDAYALSQPRADLRALVSDQVEIETWQDRRDSALAFIGVLRLVLLVVLGLIILVSAFNIFAGQLMLTDSQRRAIAVMRSFGTSQGSIVRIFLASGLFIGLLGACIGLVLGGLIADNFVVLTRLGVPGLEFFAQSPPILHMRDLGFAFLIAVFLAFMASILPARSAARTLPVEAFRYG